MDKPEQPKPKEQPKRKRGRPESRVVKIDDSPRNVARALFGMRRAIDEEDQTRGKSDKADK